MADALNVWMNGVFVGVWEYSRSRVPEFRYDQSWIDWEESRPLSLAIPFRAGNAVHRGPVVSNYFENLLPESEDIRKRISTRYKTKSQDAFELLHAIGRDCVGAVQLLPVDATPEEWDRITSEVMTEAQVAQELRAAAVGEVLGQRVRGYADFRISIAGAQEKTALLRYGGKWYLPQLATPTTHILKLPLGRVANGYLDMRTSVPNEWLCAKLLREMGFIVANTEMAYFEDQQVLVVERFDRRWQGISDGAQASSEFTPTKDVWIARLPQEDMCQVAGLHPSEKYEADGGPGMRKVLEILNGSANAAWDRASFVRAQLAFWLLAATDGHAKNFSVALHRGGGYQLTPLYDVLSAWPVIGSGANKIAYQEAKLAMGLHAKNVHYRLKDIRVRHWKSLAAASGADGVWSLMVGMVEGVEHTLERVQRQLPTDFPSRVWESVSAGMKEHARIFLKELASLTTEGERTGVTSITGVQMAEQFSFPGFGDSPVRAPVAKHKLKGAREPYSLFFSIFPSPSDAAEIAKVGDALARAHGLTGKALPPHRLHVTCHDLGNFTELPQDLVDAAVRAGDALAFDAFDVVFDIALSYPSAGTYVLSGREETRQLTAFREQLGESMRSQGLRVSRSFTPHMTLVYDRHVVPEHSIDPVRWRALEFVLIRSHVGKGLYDVLGWWPLAE